MSMNVNTFVESQKQIVEFLNELKKNPEYKENISKTYLPLAKVVLQFLKMVKRNREESERWYGKK